MAIVCYNLCVSLTDDNTVIIQGECMKKQEKYYKVWGEHINIFHLLFSIIINIFGVVVAMVITRNNDYHIKLIVGLVFIVISSVINALLFKPKRIINKEEGID